MGRRKRRTIIQRPKKKLPTVFMCPLCGRQGISIKIDNDRHVAKVKCVYCGVEDEVKVGKLAEPVDAYALFMDKVYEGAVA